MNNKCTMNNKLVNISNEMDKEVSDGTAIDPEAWLEERGLSIAETIEWVETSLHPELLSFMEPIMCAFEVGYRYAQQKLEDDLKEQYESGNTPT